MIYNISDKPPIQKTLLFALQIVLSCFVASVLIASLCGVPVSAALVGAGASTLVYLSITKMQSPMYISNSGNFVTPVIMALAVGGYTGQLVGAITACIVYCIMGLIFSHIAVDNIYKVFPPALIGSVTCVIGLNLMGFIPTYVQTNNETSMWGISVALVTMVAIALLSHYSKGIVKILPFLIGTFIGYIYAIILTITGIYPLVDFSGFQQMKFLSLPDFAFFHYNSIPLSAIISIVVIYIAYSLSALMECLSDHAALGGIIGTDLYKKPGLGRIFCGEGLSQLACSIFGGLNSCSYGESVGCVGFSKVGCSVVTLTAALIMIILGFLDPVQVFINSIPSCVFAGNAMVLYGFIAVSGIKMLQKVDLNIQKNLIITSVVLSLGICGIAVGGETFALSGTALALVVGIVLNLILKDND